MPKKENNDYINDLSNLRANVDDKENEGVAVKKTMTPEDLVHAVLGDDPKALINAIQGKRAKRLGKNNPPDKYENRTIGIKNGKAVVTKTEFTKAHLDKEKAKEAAAKKAAKDKKEKEE